MSVPVNTTIRYRALCDRCSRPAWWRQHPSEPFPHCTCLCDDTKPTTRETS